MDRWKLLKSFSSEFGYFWRSVLENFPEWIVTACLGVCSVIISLSIEPKQGVVFYENFSERYQYVGETLSTPVLGLIIIVLPCFVIGLLSIIYPRKMELAFSGMSFAQAMCLTFLITEALKVTVARPRPNFFDYCQYDQKLHKCTGPAKSKRDSRLSFPSGHASMSFTAGTWMYLFLGRFFQKSELWFLLVRMIPLFVAIAVSATRIIDHMHHVSDVVSGAILGIGIGFIFYTNQHKRIFMQKRKREDEEEGDEYETSLLSFEDEI
ncbi:PAP2 superfamily protein [Histomonas meleagridis]|uniref:PAP2 superfamily protein n=1 Tax=Histomonas meleagridis TaxID=135588 RepID=UPI003559B380|nr:PAP2 superfamily protein [Histomonas meleagridis]KAH0798649.1 PAP2 superfamily protein [Histomonas meleagridis]